MTDDLAAKARAAGDPADWYDADTLKRENGFYDDDAAFIAAASPEVIEALIAERDRLRERVRSLEEDCQSYRESLAAPEARVGLDAVIADEAAFVKRSGGCDGELTGLRRARELLEGDSNP